MTARKKGRYWYGDASDLPQEIVRYSAANGYACTRFAASVCVCGHDVFKLETDEDEGVARRICCACGQAVWMGDSADYATEAEPEGHECVCGSEAFHLVTGVALYDGSQDVRWTYIGGHCTACQLIGVFADYKGEAGDVDAFLSKA